MDSGKIGDAVKKWRADPVAFVEDNFGIEPFDWQKQVLEDVGEHKNVAIKSGHGVGKTALLSWINLWFMMTHPHCRIPCTAATENQLRDTLWPEIETWLNSSGLLKNIFETTGERVQAKEAKKTWFAVARASSKPDNLAGFHADNLMYIIDEASGIDDEIIEAVRGALTNQDPIWIMAGNPVRPSGYFFRIFDEGWGDFETYTVNSEESENVSQDWVEKQREDYGENSSQYRVRVLGKFPRSDSEAFIHRDMAMKALENDDQTRNQEIDLGIDVAGGGDNKSVIISRNGVEVIDIEVRHGDNTQELAQEIVSKIGQLRSEWSAKLQTNKEDLMFNVKIDSTGIGKGCADRCEEELAHDDMIKVVPVNFGQNPYSDEGQDRYINAGTAAWGECRDRFDRNLINIPNTEKGQIIVDQFSQRRFKMTSSGKIKLEPKSKMKRRGIKSPDFADACALAFYDDYEDSYNHIDVAPRVQSKSNHFGKV